MIFDKRNTSIPLVKMWNVRLYASIEYYHKLGNYPVRYLAAHQGHILTSVGT